jgi:hypothetical protein
MNHDRYSLGFTTTLLLSNPISVQRAGQDAACLHSSCRSKISYAMANGIIKAMRSEVSKASSRKRVLESEFFKASSRKRVLESEFLKASSRKRVLESEFSKASQLELSVYFLYSLLLRSNIPRSALCATLDTIQYFKIVKMHTSRVKPERKWILFLSQSHYFTCHRLFPN